MDGHPPDNEPARDDELYRLLAENVRDYAIFLLDHQGRVQTWNPGAERLLGYSKEEIIGLSSHVFFTPEDIAKGAPEQEMRDALTLGRGEDDRWHVRKDGSLFWSSGMMTPLWNDADNLRGFAKIMRDRTEWKQADEARRESEARKAAILEASLDGIITIGAEGRIVEFNPAAERMFGFRRDDVVGQKMVDLLIPPQLRESYRQGMTQYLSTGEGPLLGKRLNMPALRADGTEFPIELAITEVPTGGAPLFTAYTRDITARHSYERRQAVQLGITQVLAEASTIGVAAPRILEVVCASLHWEFGAFWLVDDEAQVLHCMETWQAPTAERGQFEASTRDRTFPVGAGIPGRVWQSGKPLWLSHLTPDDRFPRLAMAMQAGYGGAFAMPILIAGQIYGVLEFFGHARTEPDRDLLKTLETIGGHIGQFVERKKSEASLQEAHNELEIRVAQRTAELELANQFLKALLESLHDGIAACDANGTLTVLNRAATEFHGLPQEAVPATDWAEHYSLYHADGITQLAPDEVPLYQALQGERVRDVEIVIVSKQGSKRTLLTSGQPFYDEQGRMLGAVVTMQDVTARRRAVEALRKAHQELEKRVEERTAELAEANESLKEADRRKNEFLAMLAHELRNPLTPIRTGLDLLAMDESSGNRKTIELMQHQIEHLVRLVDDLLDVSRIIRGKIHLQKAPVELASLIDRSVETMQPLAASHQQELVVSLPEEPIHINADSVRVVQVLENLLNNATKYTETGGKIEVAVETEAGMAVVTVRDTGVGIDPELLPQVFDLFTQSDRSLDRSQGGLGLGLTLVKQLVEMHGGTVEARSEGPGCGSEFIVRLPLAQMAAQANPQVKQSGAPTGRRILVVDDNEGAAWMLSMLLQKLGNHQIDTAHDGHAALEKIEQLHPEIVILDIGLPGMDGYEVGAAVRKRSQFDDLLLIAMTGYGQDEDRRRSKEIGFDEHLTKPPSIDQMRMVLAHPKLRD